MESELVNLQRRVTELEAALAAVAAQQRPSRHRWRAVRVGMFCAGIVAIGLAVTLATSASATLQAQGPSTVIAPFKVVDGAGRVLFSVEAGPAGGNIGVFNTKGDRVIEMLAGPAGSSSIGLIDNRMRKVHLVLDPKAGGAVVVGGDETTTHVVEDGVKVVGPGKAGTNTIVGLGLNQDGQGSLQVFNSAGQPAAEIRSTTQAGAGEIRIMEGGSTKISLGITTADAGSIYLFSKTQAETIINGDAGIQQRNAQRQPVAQLGIDDNGQGYAMVANRAGTFMSKISVATDGSSGRVEVSQGAVVKALMGVLQNGKGDVCANGEKGSACLSQVNPRY